MILSPVLGLLFLCLTARGADSAPDAEALLRQGRLAEAIAAATTAATARPADLEAQELYVDLLMSVGLAGRAERELRARVQVTPTDPDLLYLLGRATADGAAAQAAYEAALRLNPAHARAHMGMGAVHEARRRIPDALAAYQQAVARDGTLGEAWLGRVRMLVMLGRGDEAIGVARQGLMAVPHEPGLALTVAHLAPDRAGPVLEEALRSVPDEPALLEALAAVRLSGGDAPGALALVEQALAIEPARSDARRTWLVAREVKDGRLEIAGWRRLEDARLAEASDARAALQRYPELVAAFPRSALVRLGRASVRQALGDPAGALTDLQAAVALDPTNGEAQAAAGLGLLAAGDAAAAEPLLAQALVERPWDPSLGLARARALQQAGRPTEADRALEALAAAHLLDPAVQVAWADALLRVGKVQEAYRVLKQALAMLPDPRLAAAFVQVAPAAGHPEEAAAVLDQIVAATGNPALAEAAKKLREKAP